MLVLHRKLSEFIIHQAQEDHPIETCGIVAGPAGFDTPTRIIPMYNMAQSEDFFQFESKQQLEIWKEMERNGEEPVVIYHSHTSTQAYPSLTDIQHASEPGTHYLIVSTDKRYPSSLRSFRINNGKVIEERVKVVDEYREKKFNHMLNIEHVVELAAL